MTSNRLARREVVGAAILGTSLIAAALLRPLMLAVAPRSAVEAGITERRFDAAGRSIDPWGRPWLRAPTGMHDSPLPIYSAGPDGVDDTQLYFDARARFDEAFRELFACPCFNDRPPDALTLQQPHECEHCALVLAKDEQLWTDLFERARAGPRGDDLFVRGRSFERTRLVFSGRLERGLALGGVILAWLLGARPLVVRHPRWIAEAWRVLVLASVPAVVLTALASRVARPQLMPFVVVGRDPAVALSAGAVCLIAAAALRLRAPAAPEHAAA